MRLLSRSLALAVAFAGLVLPNVSQSQVVPAIKGGGSQINVYGLYSLVNPNGRATLNYPPGTTFPTSYSNFVGSYNQGEAVGADFRLGRFAWGQPALGARLTFSSGNFGKQNTYMFGPELHYAFGKFRPYGNILFGKGDVIYHSTNFHDDSIVLQPGAGVDYHLNHRWSVRLVDFQYQFWNLSVHNYPAGLLPGQPAVSFATKLQPWTLNFGIAFRIR